MGNEQCLSSIYESMVKEKYSVPFFDKYSNCLLSTSSWVDIETFTCEKNEIFSLSLRAKLLYGKHKIEDLVNEGSFGSKEQIIETLRICDEKGLLVIDKVNDEELAKPKKKANKFSDSIFQNIRSWLSR